MDTPPVLPELPGQFPAPPDDVFIVATLPAPESERLPSMKSEVFHTSSFLPLEAARSPPVHTLEVLGRATPLAASP